MVFPQTSRSPANVDSEDQQPQHGVDITLVSRLRGGGGTRSASAANAAAKKPSAAKASPTKAKSGGFSILPARKPGSPQKVRKSSESSISYPPRPDIELTVSPKHKLTQCLFSLQERRTNCSCSDKSLKLVRTTWHRFGFRRTTIQLRSLT